MGAYIKFPINRTDWIEENNFRAIYVIFHVGGGDVSLGPHRLIKGRRGEAHGAGVEEQGIMAAQYRMEMRGM